VEARLKTAIAKEVHKRFASPSFPPELRLQVMKAGVLQNASCWHVYPRVTVDQMRNGAFSSLLPSELWDPKTLSLDSTWLDSNTRDILVSTAIQVFLNNNIFKIDSVLRKIHGALRLEIPQLLEEVGAAIRYLDVAVRVDLHNLVMPQVTNDAWDTIKDMKSLKRHFPNLNTCILTMDVYYRLVGEFEITRAGNTPIIPIFDERLLQSTIIPSRRHNFKTLNDALAKFFEVFADEGPGKLRFVRLRSRSVPNEYSPPDDAENEHLKHFSYGPLVRAERINGEEASFGARLVDAAYKLERTRPRLLSQQRFR
jgi:hypothetical protein